MLVPQTQYSKGMVSDMAEVAIVGTSPVLLFEAVTRARQGHTVRVFAGGGEFGGSWWVDDRFGFTGLETACHLLEADEDGYAALNSIDGIDLAPMDPAPQVHIGGRSFLYGSSAAIAAAATVGIAAVGRVGWHTGRAADPSAALAAMRTSATVRMQQARSDFRGRRHSILYPRGGAHAMLQALHLTALRAGVFFDPDLVSSIESHDRKAAAITLASGPERVDRVVVSAAYTGALSTSHSEVSAHDSADDREHAQTLLLVESNALRPLSYERWLSHPTLLRVADLSATATRTPDAASGVSPLIVGTRTPTDETTVLEALLDAGVLLRATTAIASDTYVHRSRDRSVALTNAATDTAVEVIPSFGDLSRSLGRFRELSADKAA